MCAKNYGRLVVSNELWIKCNMCGHQQHGIIENGAQVSVSGRCPHCKQSNCTMSMNSAPPEKWDHTALTGPLT